MIQLLLLVSRQGKVRLSKYFVPTIRPREIKEIVSTVLHRSPRLCNVIEYKEMKLIYRRYASLYFIVGVDATDNELITLEAIHHFVEILDKYFGNVCELDLIFNFHKVYYLVDELFLNGCLVESSKRLVLKNVLAQDGLMTDVETVKSINK
jgi:AP-1 complex subunit sigma 1/2